MTDELKPRADVRDFDIEDLKIHHIRKEDGKRHLALTGNAARPGPADDVDQAFGGSGERSAAVPPAELEERVIEVLKTIYDPEIPLNVYDLGLIYDVSADEEGNVEIKMTLTAPACPVAGQIVKDVATRSGATPGVIKTHVQLVWDPPWTKDRMTDDALLELGLL